MQIDLTGLINLQRIDLEQAVVNALLGKKETILKFNDEQLDKGEDSNGKDLGKYKNFKYKGRFSPIDLKDKNDYRNAEDIVFDNSEMVFIDSDFKDPFLTKRFGPVKGLNEQNIERTAQLILPDVITNLENQIS